MIYLGAFIILKKLFFFLINENDMNIFCSIMVFKLYLIEILKNVFSLFNI